MRITLKILKDASLVSKEGVAGKLVDLYMQTSDWRICWLVVRQKHLIYRYDVLISPRDVSSFDHKKRQISTVLSLDEIRAAKLAHTEIALSRFGLLTASVAVRRGFSGELPLIDPHLGLAWVWTQNPMVIQDSSTLMSCNEIRAYRVDGCGTDGDRIVDLTLKDWCLDSFLVEKGRLIQVDWIRGIDWRSKRIHLVAPRMRLVSRATNRSVGPIVQENVSKHLL